MAQPRGREHGLSPDNGQPFPLHMALQAQEMGVHSSGRNLLPGDTQHPAVGGQGVCSREGGVLPAPTATAEEKITMNC